MFWLMDSWYRWLERGRISQESKVSPPYICLLFFIGSISNPYVIRLWALQLGQSILLKHQVLVMYFLFSLLCICRELVSSKRHTEFYVSSVFATILLQFTNLVEVAFTTPMHKTTDNCFTL